LEPSANISFRSWFSGERNHAAGYDRPHTDKRPSLRYGAGLGENVTVYMQGFRHSDQELAHWCEVIRDEDGARLANIFTKKKPLGGLNGS